jgi:membrane-associated protein
MIEAAWVNPGILDLLVHFPDYLAETISRYREWTYLLMFGILAAETGLVFFGWLPGDTMLFTAGILASGDALDMRIVLPLMSLAAFTGDQLNYLMGRGLARRARENSAAHPSRRPGMFRERIERAKRLYARHGGQMVIIGRFIPVLSSLAPLAAALSGMGYRRFFPYSAAGCLLWTGVFTLTGYFFGKIPMVREHFWIALFGVILFSILSALAESWWQGREGHR